MGNNIELLFKIKADIMEMQRLTNSAKELADWIITPEAKALVEADVKSINEMLTRLIDWVMKKDVFNEADYKEINDILENDIRPFHKQITEGANAHKVMLIQNLVKIKTALESGNDASKLVLAKYPTTLVDTTAAITSILDGRRPVESGTAAYGEALAMLVKEMNGEL